jgi:hypothetical protein
MSAVQGPVTRWKHTDGDPKAALARALSTEDFRSLPTSERVRRLRSLAIATVYATENARMVGVGAPGEMETLTLGAEVAANAYATRQHCYAASTIARSLQLFADPGRHVIYDATTRDGEPASLTPASGQTVDANDVAFPPLLVGAIVVVAITAFAAAACYCGQASAEVIDRKLADDALTVRMMATQGQAVALVDAHSERERAAGHPISWTAEELKLLDSLLETQHSIAARSHTPLPNPFPGAVAAGADVGRRLADTGIGLGVAAALVAGAYVLTR